MFYTDGKLQYPVRVDAPNPTFVNMLQQALGGVEGEIRVMLQYLCQAASSRGPKKYRDLLLEVGTEEIAHVQMVATVMALNLEGASFAAQEAAVAHNSIIGAIMGGMNPRHYLSAGLGALPCDASGVPFSASDGGDTAGHA